MAVVAVDVDDVLVPHFELLFTHLNGRFGSDVRADDWHARYTDVNAYARDWGVPVDQVVDSVQELIEGEHAFPEPMPGAAEALGELARTHRLVVITARHQRLRAPTVAWLDTHFAGLIGEVHVLGAERWGDGLLVDKAATLREIGASVLVDDNLGHCVAAARAGLRAVLFGDYGWNRSASLPAGVARARDWAEVSAAIRAS